MNKKVYPYKNFDTFMELKKCVKIQILTEGQKLRTLISFIF